MVSTVNAHAVSPAGSTRARTGRFGFSWGSGRSLPRPAAVVSDEQILALVAAAQGLGDRQRQRQRCVTVSTAAADERLLRLDWAVRTGRLVLAERAGPGSGSSDPSHQAPPSRLDKPAQRGGARQEQQKRSVSQPA